MKRVTNLGLEDQATSSPIKCGLNGFLEDLQNFLHSRKLYITVHVHTCVLKMGHRKIFISIIVLAIEILKTNSPYEEKQRAGKSSEKTMLSILWDLEELNRLNKEARTLITTINVALDVIAMPEQNQRERNLAR